MCARDQLLKSGAMGVRVHYADTARGWKKKEDGDEVELAPFFVDARDHLSLTPSPRPSTCARVESVSPSLCSEGIIERF